MPRKKAASAGSAPESNERERMITVAVADLELDPHNLRAHGPESIKACMDSLTAFGQVEPLVVQKSSMRVIGGNGRLLAMRQLGWKTCYINPLDIDDNRAKALSIVLNRTGEKSHWDAAALSQIDEIIAGMDDAEIANLLDELAGELSREAEAAAAQGEGEAANAGGPDEMDLRPHEHYDYVIVLARSTHQWHNLIDKLGLKPRTSSQKTKVGCGRAIAADKLLALLEGAASS